MYLIAIIDILITAFVIYQALAFIQGRRALHMGVGVALAAGFYYMARWLRLDTVSWLLSSVFPYFVFLIIIVFQSEIRRALAQFGQSAFPGRARRISGRESIEDILSAVEKLSKEKTGALIVLERKIGLRTYIESGVALDAVLSYQLLVSIFSQELPLHDGAAIVQNDRIAAAACFLPLTVKPRLSQNLGTRHRAALGITEETDAVVVVVSEETGSLAFAHEGQLERGLSLEELRVRLGDALGHKTKPTSAVAHETVNERAATP